MESDGLVLAIIFTNIIQRTLKDIKSLRTISITIVNCKLTHKILSLPNSENAFELIVCIRHVSMSNSVKVDIPAHMLGSAADRLLEVKVLFTQCSVQCMNC